jgi:hypothetical protein
LFFKGGLGFYSGHCIAKKKKTSFEDWKMVNPCILMIDQFVKVSPMATQKADHV